MVKNDTSAKEVRVTVQLRNNRLLRCLEDKKLTVLAAAKAAKVSYTGLLMMTRVDYSPYANDGSVRASADKVSMFLGKPVGWLWPEALHQFKAEQVQRELDVSELRPQLTAVQLLALPRTSEEQLEVKQMAQHAIKQLKLLTPREELIVERYFGLNGAEPHTYEELAKELELSLNRVRVICDKGVGKLRARLSQSHPREMERERQESLATYERHYAEQRQKQDALHALMRRLSKQYWGKEWQEDLELYLWAILKGHLPNRREISGVDLQKLRRLSKEVAGWFSTSSWKMTEANGGEAYFLYMHQWEVDYMVRISPGYPYSKRQRDLAKEDLAFPVPTEGTSE